jgi:hypothetical protein
MPRVYATAADYAAYTGGTPPSNIDRQLTDATRLLEAYVLRTCRYDTDATTGLPTDSVVAGVFRDAVCAQVQWWQELGDQFGTIGLGWGEVRIGSVMLSKGDGMVPARMVAPQAWDALKSPDLTRDRFRADWVTM